MEQNQKPKKRGKIKRKPKIAAFSSRAVKGEREKESNKGSSGTPRQRKPSTAALESLDSRFGVKTQTLGVLKTSMRSVDADQSEQAFRDRLLYSLNTMVRISNKVISYAQNAAQYIIEQIVDNNTNILEEMVGVSKKDDGTIFWRALLRACNTGKKCSSRSTCQLIRKFEEMPHWKSFVIPDADRGWLTEWIIAPLGSHMAKDFRGKIYGRLPSLLAKMREEGFTDATLKEKYNNHTLDTILPDTTNDDELPTNIIVAGFIRVNSLSSIPWPIVPKSPIKDSFILFTEHAWLTVLYKKKEELGFDGNDFKKFTGYLLKDPVNHPKKNEDLVDSRQSEDPGNPLYWLSYNQQTMYPYQGELIKAVFGKKIRKKGLSVCTISDLLDWQEANQGYDLVQYPEGEPNKKFILRTSFATDGFEYKVLYTHIGSPKTAVKKMESDFMKLSNQEQQRERPQSDAMDEGQMRKIKKIIGVDNGENWAAAFVCKDLQNYSLESIRRGAIQKKELKPKEPKAELDEFTLVRQQETKTTYQAASLWQRTKLKLKGSMSNFKKFFSFSHDKSLMYEGEVVNLKLKTSALNEPTRLNRNYLNKLKEREGIYDIERDLERRVNEEFHDYFLRWKDLHHQLGLFYNSYKAKKRRFDHQSALKREQDLSLSSVLKMADKNMSRRSDGTVAFCFGDSPMGVTGQIGDYGRFQNYVVKKLRQLGYKVIFRSEYLTSQKFPIHGFQTEFSGSNRIRVKYCKELDIHIHRDIMAAENMADILASEILNRERPFYLSREETLSQSVKK